MVLIKISYRKMCLALALCMMFTGGAVTGHFYSAWHGSQLAKVVSGESEDAPKGKPIRLPIVMYHQISTDRTKWNEYTIPPEDFKQDMLYLMQKGYESVDVTDLLAYVHGGTPLPEKPMMVTFDDGYLSNDTLIMPILQQYGIKAVFSIVGQLTDAYSINHDKNVSYAYLDWNDVKRLVNSPYVEIQNHSYNMHKTTPRKGCGKLPGESYEAYAEALKNDIGRLQDEMVEHTGYRPLAFTYPYGNFNGESQKVIKEMGFLAAFTCSERVNLLTGDEEELYHLGRFNRPYGVDRVKFFARFEK